MRYLERKFRKNGGEAVSPVIGVMLMLVVTIIIAAVVSGFAGGLVGGNNQKTPTLSMDVKIVNTGSADKSGFSATVLSISEPTLTKNLKLSTSWVTTMKDNSSYPTGSIPKSILPNKALSGGNTTDPTNTKVKPYGAPFGFGPGVSGDAGLTTYTVNQYFGNFTLTQGTGLIAEPASGYTQYQYKQNGATETVLGLGWEQLRPGDMVSVHVVYLPTNKIMFEKDVVVTGA